MKHELYHRLMTGHRVNATFETVGGFWPPDRPDERIVGTLSAHNGRLQLLGAPTYQALDQDGVREAWTAFGSNEGRELINVLCGKTKEGLCTLLRIAGGYGGGTFLDGNIEIKVNGYRVGAAVIGLHLESANSESIDSATYDFTKLHNWQPVPWQFTPNSEGRSYVLPWQPVAVTRFSSVPLRAEIIFEILTGGGATRKKTIIRSVPQVRIIPDKSQSLEWFDALSSRLENFFMLLMGTSLARRHVRLFRGEDSGCLVSRSVRQSEKANQQLWVDCKQETLAKALAIWLGVPESGRSVERTLFGMARKPLSVRADFLNLSQALEGFGRTRFSDEGLINKTEYRKSLLALKRVTSDLWGDSDITKRVGEALCHANETSFAQKIGLSYDLLSPDLATMLLGDKSTLISKVVQTRNHYTHVGIAKRTAVVEAGKDLFLLNERLYAFIRCVMLLELGIPENDLREPILYQASRWR